MTTSPLFDRIVAKCTDVEVGDASITFHCDCGQITLWRVGDSLYTDPLDIPLFFWVKMCQRFWLALWQWPIHSGGEILSLEELSAAFQRRGFGDQLCEAAHQPAPGDPADPQVCAREHDRRREVAEKLWQALQSPRWV